MKYYSYDPTTKEYTGFGEAQTDPLETKAQGKNIYLLPAVATFDAPPECATHEVACWNGTDWEKKANYRGETWYKKATQQAVTYKEIGEAPDETMTNIPPTDPQAVWNGSGWEIPFDVLKQRKKAEIASDRYSFETAGMPYGDNVIKTDRESVSLLKGAYDEACANPDYTVNWKGENGFITLNAEEIKIVYQRVRQHVQSAFDAEMRFDGEIDAATTAEELADIEWVDPN